MTEVNWVVQVRRDFHLIEIIFLKITLGNAGVGLSGEKGQKGEPVSLNIS